MTTPATNLSTQRSDDQDLSFGSPQPARLLLVTGCGRSGTKYISFVLRRLGLDVPHERLGADGISAWDFAGPVRGRPYGPAVSVRFEQVFHQVRHPLDVIASVATFGPESWSYIYANTPCTRDEPLLVRAARYWLGWNERVETIASWRYRIESLPTLFPELCERLGVDANPSVLARVATDVNTRRRGRALHLAEELLERMRLDMPEYLRHWLARPTSAVQPVSWLDLERADAGLAAQVREKALEYGYAA
jgi:hypothetical protein